MEKLKGKFIEVINKEHGKKVIEYFVKQGVRNYSNLEGVLCLEDGDEDRFYGVDLYGRFTSVTARDIEAKQYEVIKLPEEPEFEVGTWYTSDGEGDFKLFNYQGRTSYGFGVKNKWCPNLITAFSNIKTYRKAKDGEVRRALLEEAELRGFKKGVKFNNAYKDSIWDENSGVVGVLSYSLFGTGLHTGNQFILHDGVWAEIVEEPKPFEKGKWYVRCEDNDLNSDGEVMGCKLFKVTDNGFFGFDCLGNWHNEFDDAAANKEGIKYREATKEEYASLIIQEAKRRGYKEGVRISCEFSASELVLSGNNPLSSNNEFFIGNKWDLWMNVNDNCNALIFNPATGRWAKILPSKTIVKEISKEKAFEMLRDHLGCDVVKIVD